MSAPAEMVTAAKPRKPRGPSKKTRKLLEDAYNRGMNAPRDPWPGAIAAVLLACAAFALGAWIY